MTAYRAKPPKGSTLNRGDKLGKVTAAFLLSEGNGVTVRDSVQGYVGTLTNMGATATSGWNGGAFGKCLAFDGTDDYVTVPAAIVTTFPCTIWGWFFSTANFTNQYIACVGQSADAFSQIALTIDTSNGTGAHKISAVSGDAGNGIKTASSAVGTYTNGWHFGTAVIASATRRVAYINGNPGTADTGTASPSGLNATNIARKLTSSPGAFFAGRIDGVGFANYAMSDTQVRDLYADSWRMFRRRRVPVPLHSSAATTSGLLLRRRRMMVA